MDYEIRQTDTEIEFPLWSGEFGWEIMTWIPRIRKMSRGFERVIVHAPRSTGPLYADFATRLELHEDPGRGLDYPKHYRVDGEHKCYGEAKWDRFDVLIHARGIRRKAAINYTSWDLVAAQLSGLKLACIGTADDHLVDGCWDLRGIAIDELCDHLAGCACVAGVSSGVMHLAAACGAGMAVWGDGRTYFGETLERRYKVTWNPFDVPVEWIAADDWQPEPTKVIEAIERNL
jgi:hypothetical protein